MAKQRTLCIGNLGADLLDLMKHKGIYKDIIQKEIRKLEPGADPHVRPQIQLQTMNTARILDQGAL